MTTRSPLLALCLIAAALPGAAWAAPVFPQASGVGLEPPPGMETADDFLGFRKDDATISMVELPPAAYGKLNAERARLAARLTDAKIADFPLAQKTPAFILRGSQSDGDATYRKWIVVLGDSRETAIVTAQVPAGAGVSDAAIETALRSITVRDRPSLAQQVASLPFDVGDLAGLRPTATVAGAMLVLTDGPKDDDADFAQPQMVVSIAPGDALTTDKDRLALARAVLAQSKAFKGVKVTSQTVFQQDDASWAQLTATATAGKTDKPVDVSLFVRFDEDGYVAAVGAAAQGGPSYADRFRKLALSVTLKE